MAVVGCGSDALNVFVVVRGFIVRMGGVSGNVEFAGDLYIVRSIGGRIEMPKVDTEYHETISLRLTKEQFNQLEAVAEARGVSKSEFLRQVIDDIDLLPVLSEKFKSKLRKAAGRREGRLLIEEALRKAFPLIW